jgi:hypothetical protein
VQQRLQHLALEEALVVEVHLAVEAQLLEVAEMVEHLYPAKAEHESQK